MNKDLDFKNLIHKDEKKYFVLALIVSIVGYLFLLTSVVGFIILLFFSMLSLFLNGLMIAQIRTNGVKLTPYQFPEVYEKTKELSESMGIKKVPEVYVIESGGALNAFATRFFRKNIVVLYSDIFDLINSDGNEELAFVIAHELAHIKINHIKRQALILPAMWLPFVSEAYSRGCEYTSDRIAASYINNLEGAMNGLTILAIGKTLYKKVNRSEYLIQSSQERGFFVWLSEKISTHPPLPKRIDEIERFFGQGSMVDFKKSSKAAWAIVGLTLTIAALAGFGFTYSDTIKQVSSNILSDLALEDVSLREEIPTIIEGVTEEDLSKVEGELKAGVDPNVIDANGWTPLMWAAQGDNLEIMNLLIDSGAEPNLQDIYEETALIRAISQGNVEAMRILIGAGANPNTYDSYGWTPLIAAATSGDIELVKILLEAGADTTAKDEDNFTAFLHAKKLGYKDIADLIKEYEEN